MKHKLLFAGLITLSLCACNHQPNREALVSEIESADSAFVSHANRMASNTEDASHMMELYTQFADLFPEDSLAPIYLRKAGDIAAHTANEDQAVELYNRVIEQYGDYPELSEVYFSKAWTLEQGQRYAEAKEAFLLFVDQYPDHPLAKDIRFMLEQNLIGLSVEEQYEAIVGNAN